MGVINEKKIVCESGCTPHQEPYLIPIVYDESPTRTPPQRNTSYSVYINTIIQKRNEKPVNLGKRRSQRYKNNAFVEGLSDITEEEGFEFESAPSKFQILMETYDDAIELLNKFEIERESDLKKIETRITTEAPRFHIYSNIPKQIRKTITRRIDSFLDVLKGIEENLIAFLVRETEDEMRMMPKTSYERYLMQAASIFHGFLSKVFTCGSDKTFMVSRSTACGCQIKMLFLCDYLKEKRLQNKCIDL